MTARARWPWVVFSGFVTIAVVGTILVAANGEPMGEQVPYIVAFTMFGAVGALIVSRDSPNVIGRLLLYGSLTTAVSFTCGEAATRLYERGSGGLVSQLLALLSGFGWLVGILPVLFVLPLLFPDGRLPSARWKPFLGLIIATLIALFGLLTFASPTVSTSSDDIVLDNPLYIDALGSINFDPVFGLLYVGIFGASVASLFVRYRSVGGVERQQIKWVAFGSLAAFVAIVPSDFIGEPMLSSIVGGAGFVLLPASIGIAVLRFHLYDLDVVVRKAVVYALLAVFATMVYLAIVVGVGAWLGRGSSFLTMIAAVVVALTFQPIRARLARLANRLVYGRRATPYEVLSEFSERLGDAYSAEDVLPRMARVVAEGVNAERADVWLKIGDELRVSASWPAENGHAVARLPLPDGAMPMIEGADVAYPVEDRGELLGALAVSKPPAEPLTPNDAKLVEDLAAQAGLVLRNVRLTEELRARLDDLRAAQKRIVAAQDEGRRRLERNIHDGAQQQLVALAVKARLARGLSEKDPAKAAEMLVQLESDTTGALENLRDLARGIYPPLLADQGLQPALQAQARKAGVRVEVRADGLRRYPQDVEAAAYFSVLEALQNVVKHANATAAQVTLAHEAERLTFEVVDDGIGFDFAGGGFGTGLQGIADRLGALDGALEIRSAIGAGTTVTGRIPAGSS